MWITKRTSLLALCSSAALFGACGQPPEEGDPLVCGGGTVLVNGECTPSTEPLACGEGTVLDQDTLTCVPEVACGPGTTYHPATGTCDPDTVCGGDTVFDEATGLCMPTTVCGEDTLFNPATGTCEASVLCGPDTELVDGSCVAIDRCGEGTTFNPLQGTCEPNTVCGPGFVVHEDACTTPNAALAAEADVTASEPDDPAFGGAPGTLVVPALGERVIFAGTIERPVDLDGDELDDQDVDVWTFEGEAAQVLSLVLRENGLPQPAFTLSGPGGYERSSAVGAPFEAQRLLVLPRDGTYTLRVMPSSARFAPEGAAGDESYGYVGTLEQLPWPSEVGVVPATTPEVETVEGTLLDTAHNFFAVDAPAGGNVVVRLRTEGLSTWPALLAFDADRRFLGELAPDRVEQAPAGTMCDAAQALVDCTGAAACLGAEGPAFTAFGTCAPTDPAAGFEAAFTATGASPAPAQAASLSSSTGWPRSASTCPTPSA